MGGISVEDKGLAVSRRAAHETASPLVLRGERLRGEGDYLANQKSGTLGVDTQCFLPAVLGRVFRFGGSLAVSRLPRALVLLLVLLPARPVNGLARPPELTGIVLTSDRQYASHLELARACTARKDWATATTLLQKLLDLPADRFTHVSRPDPDGKEELMAAGQAYSEKEYGPAAAALLRQGRMFRGDG
jgi:hypothetical protein